MGVHVSDRIRDALATPMPSVDLWNLRDEAVAERDRISNDAETALKVANDPRSKSGDADAAKRKHDDLTFRVGRMKAAISELDVVIDRVQHREREEAKRPAYDDAKAAHLAMVEEVRTRYPQLAGDLADLLKRMLDVERGTRSANIRRPEGSPSIPTIEHAVRGTPALAADRVRPLWNAVCLPHLDPAHERLRGSLHAGLRSDELPE